MKDPSFKALWLLMAAIVVGPVGGVAAGMSSPTVKIPSCRGVALAASLCDNSVRVITGIHLLLMWTAIAVALALFVAAVCYWVSGWEI